MSQVRFVFIQFLSWATFLWDICSIFWDGGAKKKTVLVWIYGGGFTEGDYTDFYYGPDFLLTADNIVLTIQYRVGIFGFLNLGTREYSGNMGLKDQQLALKWVYENIENFSGNKNEILLFGESAGKDRI